MDIERLNKKHYLEIDMFNRVELGLSSKLLGYNNGVFHIELVIGRKWIRNFNAAAAKVAYTWKDTNSELTHAIACKVYIVDARNSRFVEALLDSGISPNYDAKKGILFNRHHLN